MLAAVCGGVREREGLTFVDVSENAMGPDGVDACRPVIEGKKELQALLMCNDGLSEAAMEAVRVSWRAGRILLFLFSLVSMLVVLFLLLLLVEEGSWRIEQ